MRTFFMGVLGLLIGAALFSGAEAGDAGSAMLTAALGVLVGVALNQAKKQRGAAAASATALSTAATAARPLRARPCRVPPVAVRRQHLCARRHSGVVPGPR